MKFINEIIQQADLFALKAAVQNRKNLLFENIGGKTTLELAIDSMLSNENQTPVFRIQLGWQTQSMRLEMIKFLIEKGIGASATYKNILLKKICTNRDSYQKIHYELSLLR